MSDYIDSQGFRANVGIVLMRDGGELFLGGRRDGRGWQFPQGGVLRNEQPEAALYRELHEEIGLERSDVELVASTSRWLRYRLPQPVRAPSRQPGLHRPEATLVPAADAGRRLPLQFRGDRRARIRPGRWVDYWAPVREVIYFKRAVYVRALQELGEQAFADRSAAAPRLADRRMLRAPQPRSPRRRRRTDRGPHAAGSDEAMTDAAVAAGAPEGSDQ